jgi:V8-like Glu-specific endopeptidase
VATHVDSGLVRNTGDSLETIYSTVIRVPEALWIRLTFDDVLLSGSFLDETDSFLVITSLEDGAHQVLAARHLRQWRNTSAYFNGDAVRLEIVSHPGTGFNRVAINRLIANGDASGLRTICGPDDDRVPSSDPRSGRVEPIGCSVWMIDDLGHCFLSAGHCVSSAFDVVEFNVPLSGPDGSRRHPSPEDQYAVDFESIQAEAAGTGNDWAYFGCFPNSTTGLTPFEAQGESYFLVPPPSAASQTLRVTGYGATDSSVPPSWNAAQKTHAGPYTGRFGSTISYRVDTTGGNSGSVVFLDGTGDAIGIHTHGGCGDSGGSNNGTASDYGPLQEALANPQGVCNVDCNGNGISDAEDIASGSSSDCNQNRLPDECELTYKAVSGQLSPIGAGFPQTYTIASAPEAVGDVTLRFRANADLSGTSEWIAVSLNGLSLGNIFVTGASDCPSSFDVAQLTVPRETYNGAVAGGDAVFTMTATADVNPALCSSPDSFINVTVTHESVLNDCDGNGVLDECDAADLLVAQPVDTGACPGGAAEFHVDTAGADLNYQWRKDGVLLVDGERVSGAQTDTLILIDIVSDDLGLYSCDVTRGCVIARTAPALLYFADPPVVSVQPQALKVLCDGQTAVFTVGVTGTPPYTYVWSKDGAPLSEGGRFTGTAAATLQVADISVGDAGDYTCHVANVCGEDDSMPGELAIASPVFTLAPQDTCAEIGETAVFTATAVAPPPQVVSWRWKKNGVVLSDGGDISGSRTDTLSIANISADDAATYSALAFSSNPVCLTDSSQATLTVGDCVLCAQPGDMDGDGDYDLADLQGFTVCFGADVATDSGCACANVDDGDTVVELDDWTALDQLLAGPR